MVPHIKTMIPGLRRTVRSWWNLPRYMDWWHLLRWRGWLIVIKFKKMIWVCLKILLIFPLGSISLGKLHLWAFSSGFSPIGWRNSPKGLSWRWPARRLPSVAPPEDHLWKSLAKFHDDPPFFGHMKNLVGNIVLILMVNFNDYDDG